MKALALFRAGALSPLTVACLIGPAVSGCGDPRMEWNEQVRLQNGDVIVIARTAAFRENWIAGGGGGSFNRGMTLQIVQSAKPDNPGPWSARFVPIILDRDPQTQEWFVVATFFHCDSWYELGRPKLPYTEYHYREGRWIQQPLTEKLIGRTTNVLPADLSDKSAIAEYRPVLTVERKEQILNNPAISPKFKHVVGNWTTGC